MVWYMYVLAFLYSMRYFFFGGGAGNPSYLLPARPILMFANYEINVIMRVVVCGISIAFST